ncbi:CYFA0S12e02520g1_1 [Cyberlindnera fabianii]|uniref:CYFA0S12e02520g1_1 n=1 Tax=Cyberlindnera fabianii TaxID=36022 RepID=A0A061B6V8_CYBFA|nr:hypothetical protein BON22_4788 [Cyberlindnera fabianii]CDR43608.1 CYFA0S12e02520g1_1 [Cyberlindnera fabianii]
MSALLPAAHLYSWAAIWGGSGYYSYVASPIAFKTLSRKEFGALQNKVFPHFFLAQTLAPLVIGATAPYLLGTGALATLGVAFIGGAANKWWLLPVCKDIKEKRFILEDAGQTDSEEHKRLTKEFGKMHGLSLAFNMVNFLALTGYGYILLKGLIRK